MLNFTYLCYKQLIIVLLVKISSIVKKNNRDEQCISN